MELHNRMMAELYTEILMDYAKKDERICLVEADLMRALKTIKSVKKCQSV